MKKRYFDYSKKEQVTNIITSIINDDEMYCGGIPRIDEKLQEMGFTTKETGQIEYKLMEVINMLCKKL